MITVTSERITATVAIAIATRSLDRSSHCMPVNVSTSGSRCCRHDVAPTDTARPSRPRGDIFIGETAHTAEEDAEMSPRSRRLSGVHRVVVDLPLCDRLYTAD